jgi:hypothetical protein
MEQAEKDDQRETLRKMEDELLQILSGMAGDQRWKSIAKTHIEQGFMAWKRALYEGKRVGD